MNFRLLAALFLGVFVTSRAQTGECPPDKCAEFPPTVQDGKIVMKIYYDNDNPYSIFQWNRHMVRMACFARNYFAGQNVLVLDFKMGASTSISQTTLQLSCFAEDCYLDRLEGCAAKFVSDFPRFACCNAQGMTYLKCAADQGVTEDVLNSCVDHFESDEVLLGNSYERAEEAELPLCYLPDVLYNDRNDRCLKFNNGLQLVNILCGMYNDAGMQVKGCW